MCELCFTIICKKIVKLLSINMVWVEKHSPMKEVQCDYIKGVSFHTYVVLCWVHLFVYIVLYMFQTTMCHNKHHILYIVMDETTKFTSHVSWTMTYCLRKTTFCCSECYELCEVVGMKANWMFKWNQGKHKFEAWHWQKRMQHSPK
jgi:hypothetical protein